MSAGAVDTRKALAILGSTGSVGEQTLAVARAEPERFCVTALAAGRNIEKLAEQVREFRPRLVSVAEPAGAAALRDLLGPVEVEIVVGDAGLEAVAGHPADLVVSSLVGAVGLAPTLAAIRAGRDVALANKEVMVMAGALVLREVRRHAVALLPVDSEHSAIFQVLAGQRAEDVARLILTASGGPFRTWSAEQIANATIEQALNHPNWDMGPKISIDSATLMNKGLEVIEARWLFDTPADCIDVVVHPQSIIHSLVEFNDSSVIAQLGLPDMRVPIVVALAHPERISLDVARLDLAAIGRLDFEVPDRKRFPCLDLAYEALRLSEAAPAVLNAANEVAVAAFLEGRIRFSQIAETNGAVLNSHASRVGDAGSGADTDSGRLRDLDDVLEADTWSRACARDWLAASGA
ncbi:MAG: 1-deoxy-D-xylulose-5-phosphate reductoisomerase [Myxococcota bacterium]